MKRIILTLFFVLMLPGIVLAVPSVSTVTGTVTHGSTITVNGSGFGTKSTVAPLVWDNFEWGSNGTLVTTSGGGITYTADGAVKATINTTQKYGQGTRSAYNAMKQTSPENEAYEFAPFYTAFTPSDKVYMYLKARWSCDGGNPSGMWKGPKLTGPAGYYDAGPAICTTAFSGGYVNYYYHNDNSGAVREETEGYPPTYYGSTGKNVWHTLEQYIVASTPGVADGKLWWWSNFKRDTMGWNAKTTRVAGFTNQVAHFSSGHMFVNGTVDQYHYLWVDDLYIDNTLQHVMICNKSTWTDVTNGTGDENCEIQIPTTSWSDTSLQVTVNRGAFGASDTAYLYVIDSSGAANETGKDIIFGSGSGDTTAPAVTGCTIKSTSGNKIRTGGGGVQLRLQ